MHEIVAVQVVCVKGQVEGLVLHIVVVFFGVGDEMLHVMDIEFLASAE